MTAHKPTSRRPIVLASTSRYRQALLARLGFPFATVDPGVDEEAVKHTGLAPAALVAELAGQKARACVAAWPQALLIGGDQCAEIDGETLGKPGTAEQAIEQLRRLSGRTHRLLTALCVLDAATGRQQIHVDEHLLTVRALSLAQIQAYVQADRPLDCAGAYKIESLGIALFERIEGADASAITGLPLMKLTEMLMRAGFDVLEGAVDQRS